MKAKSGDLQRLRDIATEMVVQRAVGDRLAAAEAGQPAGEEDVEELDEVEREILARQRAELIGRVEPVKRALTGALVAKSEKELVALIEGGGRVLAHFLHPRFEKCALLSRGLAPLAHAHPETLFVEVNALEAPFLTQKLRLRVLPLMVFFREGAAPVRVEGFEGFGDEKSFVQRDLLRRLVGCGALKPTGEERAALGLPPVEDSSEESD